MAKNDRKPVDEGGKIWYYNPKDVPIKVASKTGWKARGFKVKKGCSRFGFMEYWNGMYYQNYELYHIDQVEDIRGEKAKSRRREFRFWLVSSLERGE